MRLSCLTTSQRASQLAQNPSKGAAPCAARMAQNAAYVGKHRFSIHIFLLPASPPWCSSRLTGDRCVQSQQAEVGQGCNVLPLMRYFDLTPPFFYLFYSAFPHFHPQQTPSNRRDPPFTNKFTRKEPVKWGCMSGNLNLCKKISLKN